MFCPLTVLWKTRSTRTCTFWRIVASLSFTMSFLSTKLETRHVSPWSSSFSPASGAAFPLGALAAEGEHQTRVSIDYLGFAAQQTKKSSHLRQKLHALHDVRHTGRWAGPALSFSALALHKSKTKARYPGLGNPTSSRSGQDGSEVAEGRHQTPAKSRPTHLHGRRTTRS